MMSDPQKPDPHASTQQSNAEGAAPARQRIAKAMARAGLCSRREAERWIEDGRVTVNGAKITSPALDVSSGDAITVDGKPLPAAEPPRLWRYCKPRGLVTTARDEKGRATVFDNLPDRLPRVVSIGRLDINSEGLLLMTNDGDLARKLELPSTGWMRRYRVRIQGRNIDTRALEGLADGITVEGVRYGPIRAELETQQSSNAWITISLQEGKNREVRRVMEHLGYPVNRLIRVSYGPFQLGNLEFGAVEEVSPRILREQLGEVKKQIPGKGGTAKAKPRPVKPGGRKGGKGKSFNRNSPEKAGAHMASEDPAPKKKAGARKGAPKRPASRHPSQPKPGPRSD